MLEVDVTLSRGGFTLSAAFQAPPGITAIFGRSGAGKSTLLNAVAGLITPETGRIAVDGTVFFDASAGVAVPVETRRAGFVFQDGRLFPHMTVAQNLRFGGTHDEAAVIEMLGIGDLLGRYPAALSGGEAQRVAIGRALISGPRVLLLDEPLASLDAPRREEVMPYLERLRDETGLPVLFVSHQMSEVARLANAIVLLENGRVTRAGPLDTVLSDPVVAPLVGVRDAGAVLNATVREVSAADGLTRLQFSGGDLILPGRIGPVGRKVRVRIPAQDVIIARSAPIDISALNVLPVTVEQLHQGDGPGVALRLRAGQDAILARITRRSAARLNLREGEQVFAILKATAVAPSDVG